MAKTVTILILYLTVSAEMSWAQSEPIRVGAKHFNEGYILSEMIALILENDGFPVDRKFNLGGTAVTFEALKNRSIDVYPEYTGTIASEILKSEKRLTHEELRAKLRTLDLEVSEPYGFSNTYALLIKATQAEQRGIRTLSDLHSQADLTFGLSYEFLKRRDGWENLSRYYALPQQPTALEHGLAYQAILDQKIDVTDAYSTDGEIKKYNLLLLTDDRQFFPDYQAVSIYTAALPAKAKALLQKLDQAISREEMQQLNALALFENTAHRKIASDFLVQKGLISAGTHPDRSPAREILQKTWVHLKLTLLALVSSMLIAIPIGLCVYRYPTASKIVLYLTGILQTIPSIALLALMIPLFGIGTVPAVVALFLYALLPILRNTVMGLVSVDPVLTEIATGLGLSRGNRLRWVELPLAMPMILTGIRIAAVINVGTATLAAFIGAGGLGEFIVTGLALNNTSLILQGAIPSAMLAILLELLFEGFESLLIPAHLRQNMAS